MLECAECGLPAEVVRETPMNGVDFDGADALFIVQLVQCVAGCRYQRVEGVMK